MAEDSQPAVHESKVTHVCTVTGNSMLLMTGEHAQLWKYFGYCATCSECWFETRMLERFVVVDMLLLMAFVEQLANSWYNLKDHGKFYKSKGKERNMVAIIEERI